MIGDGHAWIQGLIGATLASRYRIDGLIGVGGMGAVFDAEHLRVGRRVAVKVLVPAYAQSAEIVTRFHAEARTASTVGGGGVVDVLDFDVDPRFGPFLVMERLRGETLGARRQARGHLDPQEAIGIAVALLETLARVHAHQIIHRDLKPENVFFAHTPEGFEVIKIVDFGVSRAVALEGSAQLTTPGSVLGTIMYMAPEQARADRSADHRADLYSVGAILYECLTGRPPHVGTSWQQVFAAVLTEPIAPLASMRPDLPPVLCAAVDRALARDRDQRYSNAITMRAALAPFAPAVPVSGIRPAGHASAEADTRQLGIAAPAIDSAAIPPPIARTIGQSRRGAPRWMLAAGAIAAAMLALVVVALGVFAYLDYIGVLGDHPEGAPGRPAVLAPVATRDAGAFQLAAIDAGVDFGDLAGVFGQLGMPGVPGAGAAVPLGSQPDDPAVLREIAQLVERARADLSADRREQARSGFDAALDRGATTHVQRAGPIARALATAELELGNIDGAAVAAGDEGDAMMTRMNALTHYDAVARYGHDDITQCALTRAGAMDERTAQVFVRSRGMPAGMRDEMRRAQIGEAVRRYERALAVTGATQCRGEAQAALNRLRSAGGGGAGATE